MFTKSLINFSRLLIESAIIAFVVIFILRLVLRLASFLASRPWRRYRTFTIRKRRIWRKKKDDNKTTSFYCSICLLDASEGEKMRRLTVCDHCFHAECIDPWLETKSTCPLCRGQIPPVPTGNPILALIVPPGVIELFTKGSFVSES